METEIIKQKKTYKKDPKKDDKITRYFIARQKGNTKERSKEIAGYRPTTTTTDIENSRQALIIQEKLAQALDKVITRQEVADKLKDNILQEDNIPASNQAISIYKDIQEPANQNTIQAENITIVFKKTDININNEEVI